MKTVKGAKKMIKFKVRPLTGEEIKSLIRYHQCSEAIKKAAQRAAIST